MHIFADDGDLDGVRRILGAVGVLLPRLKLRVLNAPEPAEALKDARLAPADIDMPRAQTLVQSIRGAALLQGPRGRAPADMAQLAGLLCRLGEFALANAAYVSDIDINPIVLLNRPGANLCVLDALIILEPR